MFLKLYYMRNYIICILLYYILYYMRKMRNRDYMIRILLIIQRFNFFA